MKNKKQTITALIILMLSSVIIIAAIYYTRNYAEQTFDTILYHLVRGLEKSNTEVVWKAIKECFFAVIILFVILCIPFTKFTRSKFSIDIMYKNKKKSLQVYPNKILLNHKIKYALIILLVSILFGLDKIGVYTYIKNQSIRSSIFEDEYVSSEDVKITFPEEKRNLIYIFLESMETTIMSKENGGSWEYSIIPELEKLAMENINFSNTEKLGGAMQVSGTGWTVAGMVAQTSGVPLKIDITANSYTGYSSFLPGVYSLGDILEKEGYNLELMVGSDSSFGGRRDYFTVHGNYKIFDLYTAIEEGKMTKEDEVWWGYDDDDLFDWAKDEILDLASQDKPFNFVMLTADTHFYDGYLSENAENIYNTRYENVFAYSSKSVYNFIEWIKEQDFYDNTTIVIVGDHIGMQTEFYEERLEEGYTRTIYNTFINSAIEEQNSKNRQFSTLDMFPTVLASIGAEIEGERLGLGTNLFSGVPTLIEKYGYEYVNNELSKRSNFYNIYLLQENYLEMISNSIEDNSVNEAE